MQRAMKTEVSTYDYENFHASTLHNHLVRIRSNSEQTVDCMEVERIAA
jgi:hypothetical protein